MLTLEAIHKAKDYRESDVEVPEWGGAVKCRTLSMAARYEISERSVIDKGGKPGVDNVKFAAGTLAHGVIEPKMSFDEAMEVIKTHSPEAIQRLVDEVWKLSGLAEAVAKNA